MLIDPWHAIILNLPPRPDWRDASRGPRRAGGVGRGVGGLRGVARGFGSGPDPGGVFRASGRPTRLSLSGDTRGPSCVLCFPSSHLF